MGIFLSLIKQTHLTYFNIYGNANIANVTSRKQYKNIFLKAQTLHTLMSYYCKTNTNGCVAVFIALMKYKCHPHTFSFT